MNLKYYLRGLGIGIIVTAVIMSVAGKDGKESLSDAEIKARAAQLGMVEESGLLSELKVEEAKPTEAPGAAEEPKPAETPGATEEPKPAETPGATEKPKPTETPRATEEPKPAETPRATEKPKPAETPGATEKPQATISPTKEPAGEMIDFSIKPGESSYTICKRLKEYGLIASAEDFDTYLCDEGLDKRLRAGDFSIPADATPKEIAEILAF